MGTVTFSSLHASYFSIILTVLKLKYTNNWNIFFFTKSKKSKCSSHRFVCLMMSYITLSVNTNTHYKSPCNVPSLKKMDGACLSVSSTRLWSSNKTLAKNFAKLPEQFSQFGSCAGTACSELVWSWILFSVYISVLLDGLR